MLEQTIYPPLSSLSISPLNVRRTGSQNVEELAALIKSQGLLQNLVVVRTPAKGKKAESFGVIAGGRRLRALQLLAQRGDIEPTFPVPCIERGEADAVQSSVAENTGREPMHPADEFDAFKQMADNGTPVEDIAAKFGTSPLVVRRRLQLAKVSPKLVDLYRQGEMTLEVLQVFTLADSHKQQEKAWNDAPAYYRHAHGIREALMKNKTNAATSRMGQFVGLDAYEAAGGTVVRDLFGGPNSGYISDIDLLESLGQKKLEEIADRYRAEGWSFVKVIPEMGWQATNPYGRSKPAVRALTDAEKSEIAAIECELGVLNEQLNPDSDQDDAVGLTDGDVERLEQIIAAKQARIAEINALRETYTDRQMKKAGVLIGLDHSGALEIHRGMISPVDPKKAKEAEKAKAIAAGEEPVDDRPVHSEALLRKLTANRSAAMSAHLLGAPRVALDLLCATLVAKIFYDGFYGSGGVSITPNEQISALHSAADDLEGSKASTELKDRRDEWKKLLPEDPTKLFTWLGDQEQFLVVDILAYCTAACINVTVGNEQARPLERVEETLGLNMADWWQPTVKSYLGQVRKDVVTGALADVGVGELAMKEVDKLKKGDLGKKAEELLADSGWLPMPLRAKDAPAKAKASKTPAAKKAVTAAKKAPAKKVSAKKPAIKSAVVDASKSSIAAIKPGLDPAAAWPFPSNKY
jgi:ParB family transcriptional regulator, chromosome partitioning protein